MIRALANDLENRPELVARLLALEQRETRPRERSDRAERVTELVIEDPDYALPRLDLLPAQYGGHFPDDRQSALLPIEANGLVRDLPGLTRRVGHQTVAPLGERLSQRRGSSRDDRRGRNLGDSRP